jgi:hypothetical protein
MPDILKMRKKSRDAFFNDLLFVKLTNRIQAGMNGSHPWMFK